MPHYTSWIAWDIVSSFATASPLSASCCTESPPPDWCIAWSRAARIVVIVASIGWLSPGAYAAVTLSGTANRALGGPAGSELDGQRLQRPVRHRPDADHGARDRVRRDPLEQLLEHDLRLEPRQRRPEPMVDPVAEGEVPERLARDVHNVRVRPAALVAVGGPPQQRDPRATRD